MEVSYPCDGMRTRWERLVAPKGARGTVETMTQHDGSAARDLAAEHWWAAALLAIAAGMVDSTIVLSAAHVFTSHVTGNTSHLAIVLSGGRFGATWRFLDVLGGFFGGVIVATAITTWFETHGKRRYVSVLGTLEAALLLAYYATTAGTAEALLVLPAAAMGAQTVLLRRVGKRRVHTTFITGMLTNCAEGAARTLLALRRGDRSEMQECFGNFAFYGSIWSAFMAGACCGFFAHAAFGVGALLAPVALVLALALYDAMVPLKRMRDAERHEAAA